MLEQIVVKPRIVVRIRNDIFGLFERIKTAYPTQPVVARELSAQARLRLVLKYNPRQNRIPLTTFRRGRPSYLGGFGVKIGDPAANRFLRTSQSPIVG